MCYLYIVHKPIYFPSVLVPRDVCFYIFNFAVHRTDKEMNRRKDMLANLRSKVNQMATTLNMSNFANRDSLLGSESKPLDGISRASGLDNYGVVALQRQIMKGKYFYIIQNECLSCSAVFLFLFFYHLEFDITCC